MWSRAAEPPRHRILIRCNGRDALTRFDAAVCQPSSELYRVRERRRCRNSYPKFREWRNLWCVESGDHHPVPDARLDGRGPIPRPRSGLCASGLVLPTWIEVRI